MGFVGFPLRVFSVTFSERFSFQVERLWKPAHRCSTCLYPNDSDANYCQAYGNPTSLKVPQKSRAPVKMPLIDKRFTEFRASCMSKPYERQNDSLEVQLSSFLRVLVPPRRVSAATTKDIITFLISKDAAGK